MDATATIVISLIAIGLSALTAWRLGRQRKRPQMYQYDAHYRAYGDGPLIPDELKAPHNGGVSKP